jgi:phosphoglycolate phosphatase-like HAD superfamily hydrolase
MHKFIKIGCVGCDLKAEACLYVGDHPFDVLCSKHAGMDCA